MDILAEIPSDQARESYEAGKEVKGHVKGEHKKAKGHIENVVSPRLQAHKYGRCIAISSIVGQLVLFVCMMIYFTYWSCTLTFDFVDGDWDASAYDGYFANNIYMCSTEVYIPQDSTAAEMRRWTFDDDDEDTIFVDWLPDTEAMPDGALPMGDWQNCHLLGHTCAEYDQETICGGDTNCDDTKPCFGMVSVKYAVCKTVSEAVPLATGYLVYANMAFVTFCLCCFGLLRLCKCEGGEAVREVAYQIVGVVGDREVPKLDDHKGDVEMSAK